MKRNQLLGEDQPFLLQSQH